MRGGPLPWPLPSPQECPDFPPPEAPGFTWASPWSWDWEPGALVFHGVRVHPGFKVRDGGVEWEPLASDSRGSRYRTRPQSGVVKALSSSADFHWKRPGRCLYTQSPRRSQAGVGCLPAQQDRGGKVLRFDKERLCPAGRRLRSEVARMPCCDVTDQGGPVTRKQETPQDSAAGSREARKSPNEPSERKAAVQAGAVVAAARRGLR